MLKLVRSMQINRNATILTDEELDISYLECRLSNLCGEAGHGACDPLLKCLSLELSWDHITCKVSIKWKRKILQNDHVRGYTP